MVEKIEALFLKEGFTQGQFEVVAKLPGGRFSKWKSGKGEPSATQALRMSRLLRVPLDYLAEKDAPHPDDPHWQWERKVWEIVEEVGPERAWKALVSAIGTGVETRSSTPIAGEHRRTNADHVDGASG